MYSTQITRRQMTMIWGALEVKLLYSSGNEASERSKAILSTGRLQHSNRHRDKIKRIIDLQIDLAAWTIYLPLLLMRRVDPLNRASMTAANFPLPRPSPTFRLPFTIKINPSKSTNSPDATFSHRKSKTTYSCKKPLRAVYTKTFQWLWLVVGRG